MRTVGMVSWCRYRLEFSGIPVLWCRSRLVELDRYVGFSVGFSATVSARRAGSRRRRDVTGFIPGIGAWRGSIRNFTDNPLPPIHVLTGALGIRRRHMVSASQRS